MKQKLLITVIVIFLVAFFFLTLFPPYFFLDTEQEGVIPIETVKGAAVEYNGKLYTLNFEQQQQLVEFINTAKNEEPPLELNDTIKPDFSEVVIYRFELSDIDFIGMIGSDGLLVLKYKDGQKDRYIKDTSDGRLQALLKRAYDH